MVCQIRSSGLNEGAQVKGMTGMVSLLCSATNTISHLRSVQLHLLHHYNQIAHLSSLVENTSKHTLCPVSHYDVEALLSSMFDVCCSDCLFSSKAAMLSYFCCL